MFLPAQYAGAAWAPSITPRPVGSSDSKLYRDVLKIDVVPLPLTSVSNQVLGWFKKPIKSVADLRGVKCRPTGITAEVFTELSLRTMNMAGGDARGDHCLRGGAQQG